MRGRRSKPYLVKKGEGNPGKRKLNPGPDYLPIRPRCPESLVGEARRIYNRLSKAIYEKRLLTEGTFDAFLMLCRLGGLAAEAEAILRKEGHVIVTERGRRNNPEIGIMLKATAEFRHYLNEFGLTSASAQLVATRQRTESLEDLLRD